MPVLQETYDPEILVVLILFALSCLVQLVFIWVLNSRIGLGKKNKAGSSELPVSVIICAKDEYYDLKEHLPLILHQDYPEFEVLVVNDGSEDDTVFLLEDLAKDYPHLRWININSHLNFFKGKKFPLSIGIRSAKYEHIILTDADCKPASRHWLRRMQSHFSEEKKIVLGYGKYVLRKTFLHTLVKFETLTTAIRYLSWAKAGIPYMGVGRNLAYHRELFYREGGFQKHYKLPSGDDDLFVNRVAKKSNIAVETDPDSFTLSRPPEYFSQWIRQKKRHYSAGTHYKLRDKLLLGTEWLTALFTYGLFILLMVLKVEVYMVAGAFIVRTLSYMIVFKSSMIRLQEKDLLVFSPLLEALFLVFNPILIIANKISGGTKWK